MRAFLPDFFPFFNELGKCEPCGNKRRPCQL